MRPLAPRTGTTRRRPRAPPRPPWGSGWCYWPPPQPWPVRCRPKGSRSTASPSRSAASRRRTSAGGALRPELEDAAPYRLSRRHFAVVASGGGLAVRDDHSTLGTVVNGEAVGEQLPRPEAPLRRGENVVVAGGTDSPFTFRLVVG